MSPAPAGCRMAQAMSSGKACTSPHLGMGAQRWPWKGTMYPQRPAGSQAGLQTSSSGATGCAQHVRLPVAIHVPTTLALGLC